MQTIQHTLDLRYQQVQDYMDNTAYLRRQLLDLKHQITGLRALGSGELDAVLNEVEQAAGQLPDPDSRIIQVRIAGKAGFLVARIENRYAEEAEMQEKDGLPRTTKENPAEHGIGLKSVRLTVEQHGGTLQLTAQDGWFVAGVMIPAGE